MIDQLIDSPYFSKNVEINWKPSRSFQPVSIQSFLTQFTDESPYSPVKFNGQTLKTSEELMTYLNRHIYEVEHILLSVIYNKKNNLIFKKHTSQLETVELCRQIGLNDYLKNRDLNKLLQVAVLFYRPTVSPTLNDIINSVFSQTKDDQEKVG